MYDAEHSSTTRVTTADRGRSKSSPEEGNSKHTDLPNGETGSFIPAPCGISSVCFLRGIWSSAHFSKNLKRKDITCDSTQVWVLNKKDSHQIRFTNLFFKHHFSVGRRLPSLVAGECAWSSSSASFGKAICIRGEFILTPLSLSYRRLETS